MIVGRAGTPATVRPERDVVLGDRYVLVERIAVGAMGEVWEATDRVLGRPVAVKILKEELRTASTFLARFRAEARHAGGLSHPGIATVYDYARHAGGLSHPGIATVYDYGETADLAFLVMELVRGKPLSELMAQQPSLPAWAKLSVLGQTAEALAAAHDAGVVHRDVKPGNLMVRRDGTVKVTDFGIARARASAPLTETGQTIGTPTYVAPEQAVGGTATGASDVYSLGVVAYELFAGRPPFERDTPLALAYAHVNEAPPPLPPSVPARVAALIESALAKDPSRRPPIASFAAQLREEMAAVQPARSREPSHDASAPDGGIDRAVPRASAAARLPTVAAPVAATRRYRRRFSVAVAGFVGLLVILGATMWAATRPSRTDEALTDPVASTITGSSVETPSRARPPAAAPPVTDTPAAAPPATAPATQPTATQPPATQPPATQPPATQPPSTRAPATQPPATAQPSDRTVPARAATGGGVAESEALAFVVDYYERLAAGDYEATWEALSPEFRDARDLTFEDYVAYWRNTALDLGDLRFVPGPGGDQGRVRFEARYTTATRVIDETDEITLRRHPDGSLIITEQRIV